MSYGKRRSHSAESCFRAGVSASLILGSPNWQPRSARGTNMIDFTTIGQPSQLLLKYLLDRPLAWAHGRKIHYRDLRELSYPNLFERVQRAANLLVRLGVGHGDRVGVMDFDSHRYLELFFAVPMVGAVLHTINVRLSPEQTLYTIDHAGDRLLFVHEDFVPLAAPLLPRLPHVQKVVLMSDGGPPRDLPFHCE